MRFDTVLFYRKRDLPLQHPLIPLIIDTIGKSLLWATASPFHLQASQIQPFEFQGSFGFIHLFTWRPALNTKAQA